MTPERRKEVERVREEGRQAALNSEHPDTNPYSIYSMNRYQWKRGWMEGDEERGE
jgi:ribosome modulation factor